ncbi:MAG: hypothetical protein CSA81_10520 [Acidobacteria bacterium]|nr:MAG: hypothetical protein CSA81_10520 [Acidobacteriota bacterium]
MYRKPESAFGSPMIDMHLKTSRSVGLNRLLWLFLPVILVLFNCGPTAKDPIQLAGLVDQVTVDYDDQMVPHIHAESSKDAIRVQGYLHGLQHGETLIRALEVFKGQFKDPQGPGEWLLLSRLFESFPMQETAEESLKLYPIASKNTLQWYLEGMNEATPQHKWVPSDLILLHRGYAFLMNNCLPRAWLQCSESFSAGQSSSPPFTLSTEVLPLFQGPSIECVRQNRAAPFDIQFRTSPSWWFVFQPVRISTPQFKVEGISLAGLPLVVTGSTATLQFTQVPIEGDTSFTFPMDTGKSELLDAISDSLKLEDLKKQGVSLPITAIDQNSNLEPRFYWTGFRPSADLHTFHVLIHAKSLEEASYAFEYQQVPLAEWTLHSPPFSSVVMEVGTRAVNRQAVLSADYVYPFSGHTAIKKTIASSVRGYNFQHDGNNSSDARLKKLMTQWLNGPLKYLMAKPEWQEAKKLMTEDREAAVQLLWRELLAISEESIPVELSQNNPIAVRHVLLAENDRSTHMDSEAKSIEIMNHLSQILSGISCELKNVKNAASLLSCYMPDEPQTLYSLPYQSPSCDNPNGIFFTSFQSEIIRCATHQVRLRTLSEGPMPIRTMPFSITGKPTTPKGTRWKVKPSMVLVPFGN